MGIEFRDSRALWEIEPLAQPIDRLAGHGKEIVVQQIGVVCLAAGDGVRQTCNASG